MIDIPSVEQTHSSGAVPRRGVTIVRASGAHLFDGTGRRWIDCSAAHGWAALGHGHPAVTEAIRTQAGRLVMLTESASNDARARWYGALIEFLGRDFPATDQGPLWPDFRGELRRRGGRGARSSSPGSAPGAPVSSRSAGAFTAGPSARSAPPRLRPARDRFAPLVPGFVARSLRRPRGGRWRHPRRHRRRHRGGHPGRRRSP